MHPGCNHAALGAEDGILALDLIGSVVDRTRKQHLIALARPQVAFALESERPAHFIELLDGCLVRPRHEVIALAINDFIRLD